MDPRPGAWESFVEAFSMLMETLFLFVLTLVLVTSACGYSSLRSGVVYSMSNMSSGNDILICLLYTSPSPRDRTRSRMPSSA